MTYTGTYTGRFSACTCTTATDSHASPSGERGATYTHTYTTYTRTDLHVFPPLYKRGKRSGEVGK